MRAFAVRHLVVVALLITVAVFVLVWLTRAAIYDCLTDVGPNAETMCYPPPPATPYVMP